MRAFVINLDKNADRLKSISDQLLKFNIPFERFTAINGYAISDAERKQHMSIFHARMARHNPLTKGELGCTLSHTFILKKMIAEQIPVALVFEDDAQLSPQFPEALRRVEQKIDLNQPEVYLFSDGKFKPFNETDNHSPEIPCISNAMFAEAYVITLKAAINIFRVNYPVVTMNDWWGRWAKRGLIKLYRVYPLTSRQNREQFKTDVTPDNYSIGKGWHYMIWKLRRIPEKLIDNLWWIVFRR